MPGRLRVAVDGFRPALDSGVWVGDAMSVIARLLTERTVNPSGSAGSDVERLGVAVHRDHLAVDHRRLLRGQERTHVGDLRGLDQARDRLALDVLPPYDVDRDLPLGGLGVDDPVHARSLDGPGGHDVGADAERAE